MRTIRKGNEPKSLTQHRCTSNATYANLSADDREELRASLVAEQRGLCCYCLSRIPTKAGKMKVEHWHSQKHYQGEQLSYSNLLGACMGNEGTPGKQQHCDSSKGQRELSRNPANPLHRVEDLIRFTGDGKVASDDQAFNTELNSVLNLNVPFLVNNRKETLDGWVKGQLRRGQWTRTALEQELQDWNGESSDDELKAFCQIVVYYIRKRLARISA